MMGLLLGQMLGGIGIFLLAISMLTQGLQMISGNALKNVLAHWTRTPLRGIGLGIVSTAAVQSSSVTTAMLVGLANASLLPLAQTVWIVFGTNIGSTFTGWLISAISFELNLKIYALPMIGVGMLFKIFSRRQGMVATGMALAGLGLFFLGVDVLKDAFSAFAGAESFVRIGHSGAGGLLLMVLGGAAITVITQSSAAALVLILTSVSGGLITIESGAAMILGANLGTTSTALLAVIGATANAKRTAAAHILFNVITVAFALIAMPLLLMAIPTVGTSLGVSFLPVVTLAIFHSTVNVLGVIILSPFAGVITRFLESRFQTQAETLGRTQYLDRNTLTMPVLAMGALIHELERLFELTRDMLRLAIEPPFTWQEAKEITDLRGAMESLSTQIGDFTGELTRQHVPADIADTLPAVLRINRYLQECARLVPHAVAISESMETHRNSVFAKPCEHFLKRSANILADPQAALQRNVLTGLRNVYHRAKIALLDAGAKRELEVAEASRLLDHLSHIHRMIGQIIKADRHLALLSQAATPQSTNPADITP